LTRLAKVLFGISHAETILHRKIALHLLRTTSLNFNIRVMVRIFHDLWLDLQYIY